MSINNEVRYWIDENLSSQVSKCLNHNDFKARRVPRSRYDDAIIEDIAGDNVVLITGDHALRDDYVSEIVQSGISVAWVYANHANRRTQFYMINTFVYQMHHTFQRATEPAYWVVRLGISNGISVVRIQQTTLQLD